ncbi:triphosphoribosyl-dephospho-CoA synthase [Cupriavidus basilensis]|uniref:Triphosphoribosyl-dephospho-CoA synthase n=1 Tax=Cupriavidus basilensis TaxID=68895 RepID=A0ABT6B0E1_9BURK|nr:triphosphoribosyl-dephospho-CoA synthase [Cupriavidus basilensis]MDF3838209.1 triphosphoribosyl-dephospho-CoA synthase [Cupriavidus basilensis]
MRAAPDAGAAGNAAAAFLWACTLDVTVAKPGNVSIDAPGHGMTAGLFLDSAAAAAAPLTNRALQVGERIEQAVAQTRAIARCNTNLGILLLCAPLAAAMESGPPRDADALGKRIEAVLAGLTVADAEAAYRAIAHAMPAGLGAAPEQDVAATPTVGLRAAMQLAAMRDTVARQYANGYADLFTLGLPVLRRHLAGHGAWPGRLQRAVTAVYLAFLARFPDSHIARKHGLPAARRVSDRARLFHGRLEAGQPIDAGALAQWDRELKAAGLNPGTSADLTVASAMIAGCLDPALCAMPIDPGPAGAGRTR